MAAAPSRETKMTGSRGPCLAFRLWQTITQMNSGRTMRIALLACCLALLSLLSYIAVVQSRIWKDSQTLWSYLVNNFPAGPEYLDAYVNLGTAYAQENHWEEAMATLEKALVLDPSEPDTYYNLGVVSYYRGDLKRAVSLFEHTVAIDSQYAKAYFNLAILYSQEGREEAATESMRHSARLGHTDAQKALTSRGLEW